MFSTEANAEEIENTAMGSMEVGEDGIFPLAARGICCQDFHIEMDIHNEWIPLWLKHWLHSPGFHRSDSHRLRPVGRLSSEKENL